MDASIDEIIAMSMNIQVYSHWANSTSGGHNQNLLQLAGGRGLIVGM